MITVRSTINLAHQSVPNIIPVVQGDTGRAILFTLADFTIPEGAVARYFVMKPSGLSVYNDATIDGNTVLVELTAQSIIETGDNYGQVRISVDEDIVTSFDFILHVGPFRGIDAVESTTETNIFDKAVEDAREAIAEAAESAASTAAADAVAEVQTTLEGFVDDAEDAATLSESYAVGGTGTRTGEDTDNAKYYAELSAHMGVKVTDGDDEYILSLAVQQSHLVASLAQIS